MEAAIDIPKIRKIVGEKHEAFMSDVGNVLEKAIADHELRVQKIKAKVHCILIALHHENVIDMFSSDSSNVITISKAPFPNGIDIFIDEDKISLFCCDKLKIGSSDSEIFCNVNSENYDWESFASSLLDFIHCNIYSRKRAFEARLDVLMDASFNESNNQRSN